MIEPCTTRFFCAELSGQLSSGAPLGPKRYCRAPAAAHTEINFLPAVHANTVASDLVQCESAGTVARTAVLGVGATTVAGRAAAFDCFEMLHAATIVRSSTI